MSFIEKLNNTSSSEILFLINENSAIDIVQNIDLIIKKCSSEDILQLLRELKKISTIDDDVLKRIFMDIVRKIDSSIIGHLFYEYKAIITFDQEILCQIFGIVITKKIEEYLTSRYSNPMLEIRKKLYDSMFDSNNKSINDCYDEALKVIMAFSNEWMGGVIENKELVFKMITDFKIDYTQINDYFVSMTLEKYKGEINDIALKQSMHIGKKPLIFINTGSYNLVFKDEEEVVQVSFIESKNENIPATNILQFKDNYVVSLSNGIPLLTVARQDFVDVNWHSNLTEQEVVEAMYKVYCSIRDEGFHPCDIKKENFGLILRDNVSSSGKVLKEGSLVLIDNGFVYSNEQFEKLGFAKAVPFTAEPIVRYFMETYSSGIRLNQTHNELNKPISQ